MYKIVNDTFYKANTNDEIVKVLEWARMDQVRIIVDYGDVKTGKSWGEAYDIAGYVGRSTGEIKTPLLIHNKRSLGGGGLLDDCILSIKYANKKQGGYIYGQ